MIQFDKTGVCYHTIWEHSISPGLRFELPYKTESGASFELQLDIAANDPMISPPVKQTIDGVILRVVSTLLICRN